MQIVTTLLLGLLSATAIYGVTVVVAPRAMALRMKRSRAEGDGPAASRAISALSLGVRPMRSHLRWLAQRMAPVVLVSALYALVGASVGIELGVCLLLGILLTVNQARTLRTPSARLATSFELESKEVDATLRPIYLVALFATYVGAIGIGCFLGGLIGALV